MNPNTLLTIILAFVVAVGATLGTSIIITSKTEKPRKEAVTQEPAQVQIVQPEPKAIQKNEIQKNHEQPKSNEPSITEITAGLVKHIKENQLEISELRRFLEERKENEKKITEILNRFKQDLNQKNILIKDMDSVISKFTQSQNQLIVQHNELYQFVLQLRHKINNPPKEVPQIVPQTLKPTGGRPIEIKGETYIPEN